MYLASFYIKMSHMSNNIRTAIHKRVIYLLVCTLQLCLGNGIWPRRTGQTFPTAKLQGIRTIFDGTSLSPVCSPNCFDPDNRLCMSMIVIEKRNFQRLRQFLIQPRSGFSPFPPHFLSTSTTYPMARGNQRDLARAKNLKKQQESSKQKKGDPKKRMESDAEAMRRKQQEGE